VLTRPVPCVQYDLCEAQGSFTSSDLPGGARLRVPCVYYKPRAHCTHGRTYRVYRGTPGYNLTSKRLEPNVLSKNCAAVLNQIDVKAHKEAHGKVAQKSSPSPPIHILDGSIHSYHHHRPHPHPSAPALFTDSSNSSCAHTSTRTKYKYKYIHKLPTHELSVTPTEAGVHSPRGLLRLAAGQRVLRGFLPG
jgi:hypothetical protein